MRTFLVLIAICSMLVLSGQSVYAAQSAPVLTGITVAPYIKELTLSKNQTTATYNIQLTNHNNTPVLINLSAENFTNLNESGAVGFYAPSQDRNNPYSLTQNLQFEHPEIALGVKQTVSVPITVINANSLAVGGHFGAILFRVHNTPTLTTNNVTINQVSASLLFLSTDGQGTRELSLTAPVFNSFYTSMPSTINAVFTNKGNTQTAPQGIVRITDPHGKVIVEAQINVNSSLILPESSRLFVINLKRIASPNVWPGIYHVKIVYQYAGEAVPAVYNASFLFISQIFIIATIGLVILILLMIKYVYILLKRKKTKQKISKKVPDKPKARKISVAFEESEETTIKTTHPK